MMLTSTVLASLVSDAPVRTDHLTSQLISERAAFTPGKPLRIGLRFQHDPHWHTYWQNAGDSGLPTRIDLQLPKGVTASAIEWPAPHRFDLEGIVNFGYADRIILPITLNIPATFSASTLEISASATWLICKVECIPGRGDYHLRLPAMADSASPSSGHVTRWSDEFAAAAKRQPKVFSGRAHLTQSDDQIAVDLTNASLPPDIAAWEVFAIDPQVVINGAYPMWRRMDGGLRITLPQSDYFAGLPPRFSFLLVKGDDALAIDAQRSSTR